MSLFGSLSTGVSALTAQSQKTSIISNNIANLSTTGFKRSEAAFQSLVTDNSSSSLFSPGTVSSERIKRVTEQGPIQQSSSNTDISISGNGFFTTKSAPTEEQGFKYTRNGQFSETQEGRLRNAAGQYLYGWQLGEDNELPAGRDDLSSLDPVNVSLQSNNTRPTSEAEFSVNLDSNAQDELQLPASPDEGGIIKDQPSNFQRGLTVFDSQGSQQQLNFSMNKTYGPMATSTTKPVSTELESSTQLTDIGMEDGDVFTIGTEDGASTLDSFGVNTSTDAGGNSVKNISTVGDLIEEINQSNTLSNAQGKFSGVEAFLGNEGELIIQRQNFQTGNEQLTLTDNDGDGLQSAGLISDPSQTFDSSDLEGRDTFTGSTQSNTGGQVASGENLVDTQPFNFNEGEKIEIVDNATGNSFTYTATSATDLSDSGNDVQDLIDDINNSAIGSASGGNITASINNGEFVIEHSNPNADFTLNEVDVPAESALQNVGLARNTTLTNTTTTSTGGSVDPTADLVDAPFEFDPGESVEILDVVSGNSATFEEGTDGTTVQDMINFLDSNTPNVSVGMNGSGDELEITHDSGGDFILNQGANGNALQNASLIDNTFSNGQEGDSPGFSSEAFPALQNKPGDPNYNARGWWQIQISDTNDREIDTGLLNFNRDGQLNAADNNQTIDLENIEWGNGSEQQNISVDISQFSQVDGDFTVNFSDQNGAPVGRRTGVEVSQDGIVSARFSNGTSNDLFKVPLATFANANGLNEESSTAFTETQESGSVNLREAGEGGAGLIEPGTLENSNVDLADEFSKMIVSQRAYSAGTRVITTVDQMTQELLRIQR